MLGVVLLLLVVVVVVVVAAAVDVVDIDMAAVGAAFHRISHAYAKFTSR